MQHHRWKVRNSAVKALGNLLVDLPEPELSQGIGSVFLALCKLSTDLNPTVLLSLCEALLKWIQIPNVDSAWRLVLLLALNYMGSRELMTAVSVGLRRESSDECILGENESLLGKATQFMFVAGRFAAAHAGPILAYCSTQLSRTDWVGCDHLRTQAIQGLVVFASHAKSEDVVDKILRNACDIATGDLISAHAIATQLPTVSCVECVVRWVDEGIGLGCVSAGIGPLRVLSTIVGGASSMSPEVLQEIMALLDRFSYWPLLCGECVKVADAIVNPPVRQILEILLRCHSNSPTGASERLLGQLGGPALFDQQLEGQLAAGMTNLNILKELVPLCSKATLDKQGLSIVNLLRDMHQSSTGECVWLQFDSLEVIHLMFARKAQVPPSLVLSLLVPALQWKPGLTPNALRKVALCVLKEGVETSLHAISSVAVDLIPHLLSCMDDHWSPDNRWLGTVVVIKLVEAVCGVELLGKGGLGNSICTSALARLEDPQEAIRILACQLLGALQPYWGPEVVPVLNVLVDHPSESFSSVVRTLRAKKSCFLCVV